MDTRSAVFIEVFGFINFIRANIPGSPSEERVEFPKVLTIGRYKC